MATLNIPDDTLARLQAAAAARRVSVENYLDEMAAMGADKNAAASSVAMARQPKQGPAERAAAAASIRKLASEVKGKATVDELIADKHAGHKY